MKIRGAAHPMHLYIVGDCKTTNCRTALVLTYVGERGKTPASVEYWMSYPWMIDRQTWARFTFTGIHRTSFTKRASTRLRQPTSQPIFCEHDHVHKRIVPLTAQVYEDPKGFLTSKRNRDWSVDAWFHPCNLASAPAACRLPPDSSCDRRSCVRVARTAEEMKNRELSPI